MGELVSYRQNGRTLSYQCEERGEPACSLVRTHRIMVTWDRWSFFHYFLLVLWCFLFIWIVSNGPGFLLPWPVFGTLLFCWARRQRVVQEAVVVMPTLGVQLETFYQNKKVHRRFVPLQKILAPVINESVTPVTCYFYLALLVRDEDSLVLTFLKLRPPLKMLVPIWKSLSGAVGNSIAKPLPTSSSVGSTHEY